MAWLLPWIYFLYFLKRFFIDDHSTRDFWVLRVNSRNKNPLSHWMFCYLYCNIKCIYMGNIIMQYERMVGYMFCKWLYSLTVLHKHFSVFKYRHASWLDLNSLLLKAHLLSLSVWSTGNSLFNLVLEMYLFFIAISMIATKLWLVCLMFSSSERALLRRDTVGEMGKCLKRGDYAKSTF